MKMGYLLWIVLIAIALFFVISQVMGKRKYANADLTVDKDWLEKSASMYPQDDTVCRYYMHRDNNLQAQGHVVEDQDHKVIYEEKILYATATAPYEVDMINHIIDYKHHHQMSHTTSTDISSEHGRSTTSLTLDSHYKFDGVNIWDYIKSKGYGFHPGLSGLGYCVEVSKNGQIIGKFYTSNGGKNYFGKTGEVQAVMGIPGSFILECRNCDIDGLLLVALAFSRTEFNFQMLRG